MRRVGFLLLISLPLLIACGTQTAAAPTPFPTAGSTITPSQQGPISLSLVELAAAPGFYKDTIVQVTGQFRKQPLLVCESDPFPPPVSWGLGEEGVSVLASGFDQQVRTLLPESITITAEGRWRQWQGLVGCGKQARPQEIWYLDVTRIISPSPLTQITLTPASGEPATSIAEIPVEGEDGGLPSATPEDLGGGEAPPPAEEIEPTPEIETIEPPTATPTTAFYPSEEPEITPTGQTIINTPTPVFTVTIGAPTATLEAGTPTPTVPANAPSIDQGDLLSSESEYAESRLEANTVHSWTLEMLEGETFTVSAIAPLPANVILSVARGEEIIINQQNTAAAGSSEIVTFTSDTAGNQEYRVLVQAEGGLATDYAILPFLADDFPTVSISGLIDAGNPRSNISLEADSVHFWFFTAESGRNLTIRVIPDAQGDPVFYLYGPGAEYIDAIDNGFEGDEEIFQDTLPETGLYAIRVYEFNYAPMTYRLEITFQ